jgi:hypothetical protein
MLCFVVLASLVFWGFYKIFGHSIEQNNPKNTIKNNDPPREVSQTTPDQQSAYDRHIAKIYPEKHVLEAQTSNKPKPQLKTLKKATILPRTAKKSKIIEDLPPASLEEAQARDNYQTKLPKYALHYQAIESGQRSWRIISRVNKTENGLSANCHYRNGARRTFVKAGILELTDLKTGEIINLNEL